MITTLLQELRPQTSGLRREPLWLMRESGIHPDPWQVQVACTPGNQLLLWHRQCGKSTTVADIALETAYTEPGSLQLLVSPSLRQSTELFRKVMDFYRLAPQAELLQGSAMSMELVNRSRIVSLPGSEHTIVGFSKVRRVIMDEAARIPDPVYYALRPMLAMSGGDLVALSTPFGKRGWFYHAWHVEDEEPTDLDKATVQAILADLGMVVSDEDMAQDEKSFAWTKSQLAAPDNPRLSKRFLANERRKVPDLVFKQEWLLQFVDIQDQLFREEDLEAWLSLEVEPLFGTRNPDAWIPGAVTEKVKPLFGELANG